MMMKLSCDVIASLKGRTLATAESCTGGLIGGALTAVPGSSAVFKGGIISYNNEIKESLLGVSREVLARFGAVSAPVAEAMAIGARNQLRADVAVSVTGLAGPDGDEFGNPVGTVFIGYSSENATFSKKYLFTGDRTAIRTKIVDAALQLILNQIRGEHIHEGN